MKKAYSPSKKLFFLIKKVFFLQKSQKANGSCSMYILHWS